MDVVQRQTRNHGVGGRQRLQEAALSKRRPVFERHKRWRASSGISASTSTIVSRAPGGLSSTAAASARVARKRGARRRASA
jgi:hypothetical protein